MCAVFLLHCYNIPQGVREAVNTGRWAKLTPEAGDMRPVLENIQVTSAGADVNDVDEVIVQYLLTYGVMV